MATPKLLSRSRNRMICGVCSGIGEYLDIDPTLIRVLWILLTLLSMGIGVVLYLALCFVVPERPRKPL